MAVPRRLLLSLALAVGIAGVVGLFVADPGSTSPDPVPFEDTVETGVVLENAPDDDEIDVPQAQVFYSQYEYVVGYNGIERFVDDSQAAGHEDRFGYPLSVHVSDYSETNLELSEEGHPIAADSIGWVDAEEAAFVVDSEARTPAGETVVPFSDQSDAEAFATAHDGTVLEWAQLLESEFSVDDADVVRDRVDDRHARADALVADAETLQDRPVEVVVGDDVETVADALEAAPAESTILLEGDHDVPDGIEVDRPLTIAGDGNATLQGDDNGTVLTLDADRAAVTDLEITGVGDVAEPGAGDVDSQSDDPLEMAYGQGDAGIEVNGSHAAVENVTIETPSNGVLLRDSPETVVRNVTVYGSDHWSDGYMGVLAMRSTDAVVTDSRFVDGRDGVYAHRSDGLVYRNNSLENNRIGVHLMYTSSTLIVDNRIDDAMSTGIDVMTDPEHNAIVGNEVRGGSQGILTAGSRSYVANNLVTDAEVGLTTAAGNSIYEHNVLAGNALGAQANQLLPTNRVRANDFVGNYEDAEARLGALRVWTDDGSGNFWHGATGETDGDVFERSYSPTHPVDERLHRVDGTETLAHAPATDALAAFEDSVSGMRSESIVDLAPLCEPANPELLERTAWEAPDRDCPAG
ncbi:NosD domain-containing protein [Natronobacterium gregoryi]|uniref:Nitrous oxidase accessory protein n=2 Tax=Natronobacterium gregoryi TaxID=44930 RepID=L0AJD1_NATGS|nr:NosD domain-containing protein [Natronobacterium gregoryi]AFZ73554.1 nitrous oxidase accessory protein [Natronobacterium gregoryi SP2]ELY68221.1 NosL family protein [Natronobacterium gregoryi SP2]PLK20546.1 nitrous oxide reductase accessory protein NosL/NosD [Natronobacterium gregoryi SP2]SFJ17539.1 Nitrous oxidase accessory protein NosD, contains tandem CASH domains [Natronobacterium gregoryi]